MNYAVLDQLNADLDAAIRDATGDFPEVSPDDIAHDMAEGVAITHVNTFPTEVDEFWRMHFGETWAQRERAIAQIREELLNGTDRRE